MHPLSGTTWKSPTHTIQILSVNESRFGEELEIIIDNDPQNRISISLFRAWRHTTNAIRVGIIHPMKLQRLA